ncbi:MAG TPA: DMT family transporter [Rhizobiaceae bacterium]|nr:DMT family transporter [Rhizobiaceae bacterium]
MTAQTRPARRLHLAGILLLAVLWGLNWPAVKVALGEIPPWSLRAIGLTGGALTLVAAALLRGQRLTVARREILPLLTAGLLTIAGFNILLAFAQLHASTSRAVIVTFTMPMWTVVFARLLLDEPADRQRLIGIVLGLCGLSALALPLIAAGEFGIGLFYALFGGISWALGNVVIRRWPVTAPALTVAAWQLLTGAACAALGMLLFEGLPDLHDLHAPTLWAMAYHVVLALAVAYLLWFAILPHVPVGVASLGTLLVPAIGVLGAMFILGEQPSSADYVGLALVTLAALSILLPARRLPNRS